MIMDRVKKDLISNVYPSSCVDLTVHKMSKTRGLERSFMKSLCVVSLFLCKRGF
jgi:hypothetical protein